MELGDYGRLLRRYWLGMLALVVLVVAIAYAYTLTQPKVYTADANGFVSTGPADNPALGSVNDQLAKSRATSYVDVATSRATAQAVIDELGLDASPAGLVGAISVTQPKDTVLLKISASAATPREAQQLADAWVRALATQVQRIEDPNGSGTVGVPQVLPIESAALPTAPASPNPRLNLMLGAVLGLGLAFGYAMARHSVDRKLRTKEDVESRFPIAVVGGVPVAKVLAKDSKGQAHIAVDEEVVTETTGAASEAFRKLRTNLMYMNIDNPPRIVVITSPMAGDGKSTVAANLAAAIDSTGQKVVLIDGDLRRPTVATLFGLVEGVGLTDVLAGRIPRRRRTSADSAAPQPAHPWGRGDPAQPERAARFPGDVRAAAEAVRGRAGAHRCSAAAASHRCRRALRQCRRRPDRGVFGQDPGHPAQHGPGQPRDRRRQGARSRAQPRLDAATPAAATTTSTTATTASPATGADARSDGPDGASCGGTSGHLASSSPRIESRSSTSTHPADPPRILEASAAVIWRAVDGTRSISAVIASVAGEFGLPSAEVEG